MRCCGSGAGLRAGGQGGGTDIGKGEPGSQVGGDKVWKGPRQEVSLLGKRPPGEFRSLPWREEDRSSLPRPCIFAMRLVCFWGGPKEDPI